MLADNDPQSHSLRMQGPSKTGVEPCLHQEKEPIV